MKLKLLFSAFCLLIVTTFTYSQKLKLGVTASPTVSFVASDNDDVKADGSKIGLVYGLMADYRFSENEQYNFFTGFVVHHTAAKFVSATDYYDVSATLLEIPAAFKLQTNSVNQKIYYGQFGFNLGVPISSKVNEGPDENVEFKGLYAAINFGAGVQFELSDNGVSLNFGLYYNNGFTNVFEIEGEKFRLKHLGLRVGAYF